MKPKAEPFQGAWAEGDELQWYFDRPVRVHYFEVSAPLVDGIEAISGDLLSIKLGVEEHLRLVEPGESIPLVHAIERVEGVWRLGPLTNLKLLPGRPLRVSLRDFKGKMRPCGVGMGESRSRFGWFVWRLRRRSKGFWERHLGAVLISFLVALLTVATWMVFESGSDHQRLLRQCMADGRKEYECEALLSGSQAPPPVVVPVVVPH